MAKTRKNFIICIQSVLILGLLCLVAFLLIRMRQQEEPAVPDGAEQRAGGYLCDPQGGDRGGLEL